MRTVGGILATQRETGGSAAQSLALFSSEALEGLGFRV